MSSSQKPVARNYRIIFACQETHESNMNGVFFSHMCYRYTVTPNDIRSNDLPALPRNPLPTQELSIVKSAQLNLLSDYQKENGNAI